MNNDQDQEGEIKVDTRRSINFAESSIIASESKVSLENKPKIYSFERRNQSLPLINETIDYR